MKGNDIIMHVGSKVELTTSANRGLNIIKNNEIYRKTMVKSSKPYIYTFKEIGTYIFKDRSKNANETCLKIDVVPTDNTTTSEPVTTDKTKLSIDDIAKHKFPLYKKYGIDINDLKITEENKLKILEKSKVHHIDEKKKIIKIKFNEPLDDKYKDYKIIIVYEDDEILVNQLNEIF